MQSKSGKDDKQNQPQYSITKYDKCRRHTILEVIGANVYWNPISPRCWAVRICGIITEPFISREDAEVWAMEQWILDITNSEVFFSNELIKKGRGIRNRLLFD